MIFQYTWPQVVTGRKTATRRIIGADEQAVRGRYNRIVAVKHGGRVKWRVGATYAVQPGRGRKQIARIRLTRITRQKLPRISTREARAEGFADRAHFLRTWRQIHGPHNMDRRVWVLEFELVETLPALQALQWLLPRWAYCSSVQLRSPQISNSALASSIAPSPA